MSTDKWKPATEEQMQQILARAEELASSGMDRREALAQAQMEINPWPSMAGMEGLFVDVVPLEETNNS